MSNIRVVVITPIDADGDPVRDTVSRTLRELGIEVLTIDRIASSSSNITLAIFSAIESSDLVIVDVSRQQANVMYELGYAHGIRKKTLLILNEETKGKFLSDLAGNLLITYNPNNLSGFREQLKHIVPSILPTT